MHVLFIIFSLYISNIFCDYTGNNKSRCPGYSFRCSNGQCIPSTSVCDGSKDCDDRSDETQVICAEYVSLCPPYAFLCAYGACVDKSAICNGTSECADSSDELLPQCFKSSSIIKKCNRPYEFQCDSGQCIDETLLCDGKSDCIDGSDENITQCINFGCPSYGFKCAYGGCIDKINKCDGQEHCKDGSDEDTELCYRNIIKLSASTPKRTTTHRPVWSHSGCLLPEEPKNGNYEVVDCFQGDTSSKCSKVPDTVVKSDVALKYSCNPGYVLSEGNNPIICKNGGWDPKPLRCLKLCKGIFLYSVDLKCYYQGNKVDCGQLMKPGTEIQAECLNTYHRSDYFFTNSTCLPDGTLSNPIHRCLPDCGIKNAINDVKIMIRGGTKTRKSEYPWHAGFYLLEGENPVYKCGGTIIHPKAILTAAHCVYDDNIKRLRDKKDMRVAVGKYCSNWNHESDEKNEQKFGVIDIFIEERYRGEDSRFEQDIAILHLNRLITLRPHIMPICLDKENKFHLERIPNATGTVVGSGATRRDGPVSEQLRVARFPVIGFRECIKKVKQPYFITYDKFCAGLSNGTSVEKGDSGSAMTFPMFRDGHERHFIYGIVSLRTSASDDLAAFTNVTMHMQWMEERLNFIEYSLKNLTYLSV